MKQQHSFHRLFFHIIFSTKNREQLIGSPRDGQVLEGLFKVKARDLDGYVEEFGCWRDHVHLLVRIPPKLALAKLYGQMKGFATHGWNERYPESKFGWQDGAYSITVDPDNCQDLRTYIRGQWNHHESGSVIERFETPETGPAGLPEGKDRTQSP